MGFGRNEPLAIYHGIRCIRNRSCVERMSIVRGESHLSTDGKLSAKEERSGLVPGQTRSERSLTFCRGAENVAATCEAVIGTGRAASGFAQITCVQLTSPIGAVRASRGI